MYESIIHNYNFSFMKIHKSLSTSKSIVKNLFYFITQLLIFFFIVPCLITIFLSIYTIVKYDYFTNMYKLNILGNWGQTITLYQCYISPVLILVSIKFKWRILEFISVIYFGLLMYFLSGYSFKTNGNDDNFLLVIVFPFIYYELMYENSYLRKIIGLNEKYNTRHFIKKKFLKKNF